PVKPSGWYPSNVAPASHSPMRSASACICGASGIPFRAAALREGRRALRPIGAASPVEPGALLLVIRIELVARGFVLVHRARTFGQGPEIFFERELAVARVLQHGHPRKVD